MNITTIGIDLAKLIFQVHGIDARGKVMLRKQLRRSQVTSFFAQLAPYSVAPKPVLYKSRSDPLSC